jgi:hypothetical protein
LRRMLMNTKENVDECMRYVRSFLGLVSGMPCSSVVENFMNGMQDFLVESDLDEEVGPFVEECIKVWKEKEMTWYESGPLISFLASMVRHYAQTVTWARLSEEGRKRSQGVLDSIRDVVIRKGYFKNIVKGLCAPIDEDKEREEKGYYRSLTYLFVFCAFENEAAMTTTAFQIIASESSGMENLFLRVTREIWRSTSRRYEWRLTNDATSLHTRLVEQFPEGSEYRMRVMDYISSAMILWEGEMAGQPEAAGVWYFK